MQSNHPFRLLAVLLCLSVLGASLLVACDNSDEGPATSTTITPSTGAPEETSTGDPGGTSTTVTTESTDGASEELVQMPFIMGLLEAEAEATLSAVGLELDPSVYWTTFPGERGRLISQGPFVEGSWVPIGTVVPVEVGARGVIVPDVVGMDVAAAAEQVAASELVHTKSLRITEESSDWGKVLAQDPHPGLVVQPTSKVNLTVGAGIVLPGEDEVGMVQVPMVLGLPAPDAIYALARVGLRADIEYTETMYRYLDGQVVEQDPPRETIVYEGSDVRLLVAIFTDPQYEIPPLPE